MPYIAKKSIRVKNGGGTYDVRNPGDAVTEAAGWKNLQSEIRAGRIKVTGPPVVPGKRKDVKRRNTRTR